MKQEKKSLGHVVSQRDDGPRDGWWKATLFTHVEGHYHTTSTHAPSLHWERTEREKVMNFLATPTLALHALAIKWSWFMTRTNLIIWHMIQLPLFYLAWMVGLLDFDRFILHTLALNPMMIGCMDDGHGCWSYIHFSDQKYPLNKTCSLNDYFTSACSELFM